MVIQVCGLCVCWKLPSALLSMGDPRLSFEKSTKTQSAAMTFSSTKAIKQMKVPLLDLQAQYATLRSEMRAAVERVFESQQFILGSEVQALENEIALYTKAKYAIGCASGSDALLLALMAF